MGMALVGVFAIIAVLGLLSLNQPAPVQAQAPGTISGLDVDLSSDGNEEQTEVEIEFVTAGGLPIDGQIVIVYEDFTVLDDLDENQVTLEAELGDETYEPTLALTTEQVNSTASTATDDGYTVITVPNMRDGTGAPHGILAGSTVTVTIASGPHLLNPAEAGTYDITVTTTSAPAGGTFEVTIVDPATTDVMVKLGPEGKMNAASDMDVMVEVKFTHSHEIPTSETFVISLPEKAFVLTQASIQASGAVQVAAGDG